MVDSVHSYNEEEVDLLELIRKLLKSWKLILGSAIVCVAFALAYAFSADEIFKAEVLLAPAKEEKSGSSSTLSQFGGIAAIAGISIPNDSNVEQVIATLQSRKFLNKFIRENKLIPALYGSDTDSPATDQPTILKAIELFKSILSVVEDKKSGLITLSIYWKDPNTASKWANDLVKQLNEQLRQKAITDSKKRVGYLEQELGKTTLQDMRAVLYNLLEFEKQKAMLANVNEDFALEVIDPAVAPKDRVKPNRVLILFLGVLIGGILGIFMVFLRLFLQKLNNSNI